MNLPLFEVMYYHAGKLCVLWRKNVPQQYRSPLAVFHINYTGQQNLTFFFCTRGKISNPSRTFNAEFKCVSSFSPSPTVCL